MFDFRKHTIREVHQMLKDKEISCVELTKQVLETLKKNEFNQVISTCEKQALENATRIENDGIKKLFDGIPCVIKDNINYKGTKTTAGSKSLENYESVYNASVTNSLLNNNCVITGKANMDEFAMGCFNTTSYFGNVLNPLDKTRVPGGSSGGSACVVASGQVPFSLGSDTGGSVRQPAAYCGIVGFRPTYGMISRYGVVALNNSLDQIGIFANNVEDTALVFDMLQGNDPLDATTLNVNVNAFNNLDFDLSGQKIGVVMSSFDKVGDAVRSNMDSVVEFLKSKGAIVKKIKLKYLSIADYVYLGIVGTELTSNLSMIDGIRFGHQSKHYNNLDELYSLTRGEGFGKEVKRRLLIGTDLLKSENHERYEELLKMRRLIFEEYNEVFNDVTFLITPTVPSQAYTFQESNEISVLYESQFVESSSLAGIPGISVPMGIEKTSKMPLGLQILANRNNDDKVLAFAKYFEDNYEVGEH